MSSGPDINANSVAQKKREDDRVEFLRRCAVSYACSTTLLGEVGNQETGERYTRREVAAESLVRDWSALWDAIEAMRSR